MIRASRRRFVQGAGAAGLALAAGCGRLPWQAPPPAKVPKVGWLLPGSPGPFPGVDTFRQALHDHGWVEGQNVTMVYRYAEGREDRYPALAADLVQVPVDVIVTQSTPAIRAAKDATAAIPIVFTAAGNPVGTGLVESLARPGGNVTGLSILSSPLSGKRVELLKEAVPGVSSVAAFWTQTTAGALGEMQAGAQTLGVALHPIEVRTHDDLDAAFAAAARAGVDALIFAPDAVFITAVGRIVDLSATLRLPAMYADRQFVDAGGLMAYAPSLSDRYQRAAWYVDRILRGTKPADLPVEQPMRFDFAINLRTAEALGLTIPPHVLLQATEVIR